MLLLISGAYHHLLAHINHLFMHVGWNYLNISLYFDLHCLQAMPQPFKHPIAKF